MVLFYAYSGIFAVRTIKTPFARSRDPVDGAFCFLILGYILAYRGIYGLSWHSWVIVAFVIVSIHTRI